MPERQDSICPIKTHRRMKETKNIVLKQVNKQELDWITITAHTEYTEYKMTNV